MRRQQKYIIKFSRVILPRAKYHSTKQGAKGYSRARLKRRDRAELARG